MAANEIHKPRFFLMGDNEIQECAGNDDAVCVSAIRQCFDLPVALGRQRYVEPFSEVG